MPQLIRFNTAEIYDNTVKTVNASPNLQPVFIMSAMSKKSGDAADWCFGSNPNKVSEIDTGRDRGLS